MNQRLKRPIAELQTVNLAPLTVTERINWVFVRCVCSAVLSGKIASCSHLSYKSCRIISAILHCILRLLCLPQGLRLELENPGALILHVCQSQQEEGVRASLYQFTHFIKARPFIFHLIQNFIHCVCLHFYTLFQQFVSTMLWFLRNNRARHSYVLYYL